MADTIKATVQLSIGSEDAFSRVQSVAQAGNSFLAHVQNVGTGGTGEALQVGECTAPFTLAIWNKDATNYVEIDSANTFDKFPQKLRAGDCVLLRCQTATLFVRANTAAVDIRFLITED